MQIKEEHYLRLQFRYYILTKNGFEFQSFFEKIMSGLFKDFIKIKPYGNEGDKKNDGFRRDEGIYYQVYAPDEPTEKQRVAVKKLLQDFEGLYQFWNESFPINEFHFVFNDKYKGLAASFFTDTISLLQKKYQSVKIHILTPELLESYFFKLTDEKMLEMGFVVDKREVITFINTYLENIALNFDRGCLSQAFNLLKTIQDFIFNLNNESINLEFKLLEALGLRKIGKENEAEQIYLSLSKIHPIDPRPLLYLAEINLNAKNFKKNNEYLEKAGKLNPDFWLYKIEKIIRELNLNKIMTMPEIDERSFPENYREKSIFYRAYALCFEAQKGYVKADQFIEKAIHFNPNRILNYITKLSFLKGRIVNKFLAEIPGERIREVLEVANNVLSILEKYGSDNPRDRISLILFKVDPLVALGKNIELEKVFDELFNLSLKCSFDELIEETFLNLLSLRLPDDKFEQILDYIDLKKINLSDNLIKTLVFQFLIRGEILKHGEVYFNKIGSKKAIGFVEAIRKSEIKEIINIVNNDVAYLRNFAAFLKEFPDLQKNVLEYIFEKDVSQDDNYWMFFYYENDDFEKAYKYLLKIDISFFVPSQLKIIAEIAHRVKDWGKEIVILKKWMELEESENVKTQICLALFVSNINIEDYLQAAKIGEDLLDNDLIGEAISSSKKEMLLAQTIMANFERGQYERSLNLVNKHKGVFKSFGFLVKIQAAAYLKCGDINNAIDSIVEGVKGLISPSPEQYGSLFEYLLQIGEQNEFTLNSESRVDDGCFVKIKNEKRWFYMGDEMSLDAISIRSDNSRYKILINKNLNDVVNFPNDKFTGIGDRIIENILTLKKYIFWKARECFHDLSISGWEMGQIIAVPEIDGKPDLSKVVEFMKELDDSGADLFNAYCSQPLPLAILAFQQGGLLNAIGKIVQEGRGYVNFSDGSNDENKNQIKIAYRILEGSKVYIDASSAIFLCESGLLKKIKPFIPNLKIPQSVINFLFDLINKFRVDPKTVGRLGFAKGRLLFTDGNGIGFESFGKKIQECIDLLETDEDSIVALSSVFRRDTFIENKLPNELVDACILAQAESAIILTEDYRYLFLNAFETKKEIPKYCSSFYLIKVMFESRLISLDEYLNYFDFLSLHRCRFLNVSADDLFRATIGDRFLGVIQPDNIKKLNLQFVLSNEYGVPLNIALKLIVVFLNKIIINDAITLLAATSIFSETITGFLKGRILDKREAGLLIIHLCKKQIEIYKKNITLAIPMSLADQKLNSLDKQIFFTISNSVL